MDLCVRAAEQRAARIVHIDLNQQGARGHIDGLGSAHQLSLESTAGKLSDTEICGHAVSDPLRVLLRDVYVTAQLSGLRDVKEIGFPPAVAAGIDEVADIRVTGRDNS